jgi:hypothetical protein
MVWVPDFAFVKVNDPEPLALKVTEAEAFGARRL